MIREERQLKQVILRYIADELYRIRGHCNADRGEHYNRGYRDALYNVRMTLQNATAPQQRECPPEDRCTICVQPP